MLDQATLKTYLHYDPDTGVFTRLRVNGARWQSLVGKPIIKPKRDGYLYASVEGHEYLLHRLAWLYMTGSFPKDMVDHRNRNRSDNRWSNLREATPTQQGANVTAHRWKTSKSGVRGVHAAESGRWVVHIKIDGKVRHMGTFDTIEEARTHHERLMRERHGEFYSSWDAPLPEGMPKDGYPERTRVLPVSPA